MEGPDIDRNFESYILSIINISKTDFYNLFNEISSYLCVSHREYIQKRHLELQKQGLNNKTIYSKIQREIKLRPFCAPDLSIRQIRRCIYG
jgi:hypothetical protein